MKNKTSYDENHVRKDRGGEHGGAEGAIAPPMF